MGIQNLFAAGGVVMWLLLGFSVLGVALIIERIRFWVRISQRQSRIIRDVLHHYRVDNLVGANY
jgi:biopolymer transport protein ExbB